jgi:PAS domain S-box-containing protein
VPTALQLRTLILSRPGYLVLTASSGEAALRLFLLNRVDLVIIDRLLPDLTGREVAGEMKRFRSEVPVILLTGLTDSPQGSEKADRLLTKGVTPAELFVYMEDLMAKHRSHARSNLTKSREDLAVRWSGLRLENKNSPLSDQGWVEANIHAILEAAPDAMVVIDSAGMITLANAQTEELFGYTRAELTGCIVESLLPKRYRNRHLHHRADFSVESRVRRMGTGLELFGLRKDGSEFPVDISLSPLTTAEGRFVTCAIRDVTERKLADEQIKRLTEELERALQRSEKLAATGRLVAIIAHEINSPLDALRGLLYLLREKSSLEPSGRELIALAEKEIDQLAIIAKQTLAQHGETKLPVVTSISQLLDDVCALFQPKLHAAQIQVLRDYRSASEVTIYASELRQIFTNLIVNAIDAMGRNGELRLSLERSSGNEVIVNISDTGCGIPQENLQMIFEPFFTTKGDKGTGLGLWVVRRIVENLGGRVEVISATTGKTGTCFSVAVPASAADAALRPENRQGLA